MKTLFSFKSIFAFFALTLLLSSCGTDSLVDPVVNNPKVDFESGTGFLTVDATVLRGSVFQVYLKGTKGDNDLKSITVQEAGVKIDPLRLSLPANPSLLSGATLDLPIAITAHSDVSSKTYSFIVEDTKGNKTTKSLIITTIGTDVTILEGILLNQSGPAGQGGLDLETGLGVGSADLKAEIRDEGVVNVVNDGTWKQQVSGANGSEIKYIIKGQNGVSENFDFSSVKLKEEVASLWTNGKAFDQKSTDGLRDVSAKVALGDVFIVKNGEKYFLLNVKNIKITLETTGEDRNKDAYTFDVKF